MRLSIRNLSIIIKAKANLRRSLIPICIVVGVISLVLGATQHKEFLKSHAANKWSKQGFEVVDYEGWQIGFGVVGTRYGGAHVFHRLQKVPDNGITYSGSLLRWGSEIHVYGPKAVEAISPK